ncbi:hypothetical protein [Kordia sp.]|uniref:hypothetical protein n=1 Tax=Kordia sp. TaxID=1965332 RepID=UPI003D6BA503
MKKKTVKSLNLAKRSISQFTVSFKIKGGNTDPNQTTLVQCPVSLPKGVCQLTNTGCDTDHTR